MMKTKAGKRTTKTGEASFCELPADAPRKRDNRSAFYRHRGMCRWQGVRDEPYKTEEGGWSNIIRRVLVGARGESARFHVRYFEIGPAGRSSLECHRHEHVVICVRGKGIVHIGKRKRTMQYLDTVYIAPDVAHQLMNPYDEPFGFICIVNSKRDRPKPLKR